MKNQRLNKRYLPATLLVMPVVLSLAACTQAPMDKAVPGTAPTVQAPNVNGQASNVSGSTVQNSAPWTPDAAFVPKLTQDLNLTHSQPKFRVKVPKQYNMSQISEQGAHKIAMMRGPQRKVEKNQTVFLVSAIPLSEEQKKLSLDAGMQLFLDAIKVGRKDQWRQTPLDHGTIGGQPFVRAQWSGVEPTTKILMRGFVYLTTEDGDYICISGQDFQQFADKSLPELNAAALTFKAEK